VTKTISTTIGSYRMKDNAIENPAEAPQEADSDTFTVWVSPRGDCWTLEEGEAKKVVFTRQGCYGADPKAFFGTLSRLELQRIFRETS
jgi:hypothetical protein